MSDEAVWEDASRFRQRRYESYEAYAEHQASKLKHHMKLGKLANKYTPKFKAALAPRIEALTPLIKTSGRAVLCLAPATAPSVKRGPRLTSSQSGIDLNPGEHNRFVLTATSTPCSLQMVYSMCVHQQSRSRVRTRKGDR